MSHPLKSGRLRRKCIYGKTRKEVAEKLAAALRDRQRGLTLHDERQTLGDFLTRWLEDAVKPKVRHSTHRSYKQIVENHLIPGFAAKCSRIQLRQEEMRGVRLLCLATLPIMAGTSAAQDAARVFASAKRAVVTVETPGGSGTGFVIGDGTLVVTAYHVVEGERWVRVSLSGVSVTGVYASNEALDVAILKLSKAVSKRLSLGQKNPAPGTKVFVIGSPLGFLSHSITEGIVSGIRGKGQASLLQITAAISPGSSGSPVLTSDGKVVGVVFGSIEEGQSLNFAVTAADIRAVLSSPAKAPAPVRLQPRETGLADVILAGVGHEARKAAGAEAPRLADLAAKLQDPGLRVEAERKLVAMGAKGVPFIIASLPFDFEKICLRMGGVAVPPLIRALSDGEWRVRSEAAGALGLLGDKRAVEPLIRALSDSTMWVRWKAAGALGLLGDKRAVEPLIRALSDGDLEVRFSAADALGLLGDTAVEPLIRALSDSDGSVRGSAAKALGKLGDKRAVEPLIRALSDSSEWVRREAAEALGRLGDKRAVEPLIRALSDSTEWVRREAADALGVLGDKRAVEPLIRALSDSDEVVRVCAAFALGRLGDKGAVELLIRALSDSDRSARGTAAYALGLLGDKRAVEPLIRALSDSSEGVRSSAADALGVLGDKRAVEPLIRALSDSDWWVRREAAEALGRLGDKRAVEPLRLLLTDEDSIVRQSAREALRKLGG